MRSVWTVFSIMAVANMFAILMALGWLLGTRRVDATRIQEVRSIFTETVGEQAAREAREAADAEVEADPAADLPAGPPLNSSEALALRIEASEIDLQRIARLQREVQDLRRTLRLERNELDRERESFETERDGFESMRERLALLEGDAQFQKSLVVLEGLKAEEAVATLRPILDSGDREQVVAYLDAMEERARTKIFAELITQGEGELAAGLLEDLRVRGLDGAFAEGTGP